MDLLNQFTPFCSLPQRHISDLHYHNLLCLNTDFMLINPENAIGLIFIKNAILGMSLTYSRIFSSSPMLKVYT